MGAACFPRVGLTDGKGRLAHYAQEVPRTARTALLGAVLAALGVLLVRVLAFKVAAIHNADAQTLHGFVTLDRPSIHPIARAVAHVADPTPYGLIGLALIGIALLAGRVRVAAAVAVVLLGTAVTTDYILKPLLAGPRFGDVLGPFQIPAKSFPSGHATASMALALCAILVSPPRWRPFVAALGAAFAVAVSYAFLSLDWHYPSDVLGGYLVAASWTGLAVAALRYAEVRWPARTGREAAGRVLGRVQLRSFALGLAALAVAGAAAVAAVSPDRALDFVRAHTIFTAGAAAIALASLAVAATLAALLRDS
jgi:membrane-associated phospholipid phosphatase